MYRLPLGLSGKESACNAGAALKSPGPEDALEEGTATPSSILAWRIPRTEDSGGLHFMGFQRIRHN